MTKMVHFRATGAYHLIAEETETGYVVLCGRMPPSLLDKVMFFEGEYAPCEIVEVS